MNLRQQQLAFARHLRDPDRHPAPPGMDAERLAVYRELFGNTIRSLLAGNFPVIRTTLGPQAWQALVARFYAGHQARTPLFPRIGEEFIAWLQAMPSPDRPWLAELAHYEWVELDLLIDPAELPAHDPHGDLMRNVPVLSPHVRILAYQWPVHRIGPDHQPQAAPAEPTLLLARRDADGRVRFSVLSPLVHALLELLRPGVLTGQQALHRLAGLAQATDMPAFVHEGAQMLQQLRTQGVACGTAAG